MKIEKNYDIQAMCEYLTQQIKEAKDINVYNAQIDVLAVAEIIEILKEVRRNELQQKELEGKTEKFEDMGVCFGKHYEAKDLDCIECSYKDVCGLVKHSTNKQLYNRCVELNEQLDDRKKLRIDRIKSREYYIGKLKELYKVEA